MINRIAKNKVDLLKFITYSRNEGYLFFVLGEALTG